MNLSRWGSRRAAMVGRNFRLLGLAAILAAKVAGGEPPCREVVLKKKIQLVPVVATGKRWPTVDELRGSVEKYFEQYPKAQADPRRSQLTGAEMPAPFAKGGGLFAVLLLLDNGDLACVLRTGAPHVGSGGELSIVFSRDKGRTWSPYRVIVRGEIDKDWDRRDASLGQAANGDLVLVYQVHADYDARGKGRRRAGGLHMEVVRSGDGGKTWSEPVKFASPPGLQLAPHGQMRRLKDGTLVFNARGNPVGASRQRVTYLYWSRDGGRTWPEYTLIQEKRTETGFLPLDDRHWVGYSRDNEGPSMIAHSYDGGRTWPRWDRMIGWDALQVRGRIPGSLASLPNGMVLATYGYREYPFGLRAVVSRDGGSTFDLEREYVLSDSYLHFDAGYPSTVAFGDGSIVTVAYTNLDLDHPEWGTACIAYRYHQKLFH